MTRYWNSRAITFGVIAIIGLIGTWTYNAIAIIERNDFVGDWFNNGPAVGSLTTDLLVMAIAGGALVVVQGWLADNYGLQTSFLLTAVCELYILFYALWGSKPTNAVPPPEATFE